jgi:hypothetical protein
MDWQILAQLGSTAFVAVVSILSIFKIFSNHIEHETKAITELTTEIKGLRDDMKDICRDFISSIKK